MANAAKQDSVQGEEDLDADAVLAELEADDSTESAYREQRAREYASATSTASNGNTSAFGLASTKQDVYVTLKSDDDTLRFTTEHERAIVHFFHADFARCSIMDDHLDRISTRHGVYGGAEEGGGEDVAFGRVNVSNAPFIVERLGVRVLPCVIGFAKGIVKGKVTGFEGICWDGKEKDLRVTKALEENLVGWGVLRTKLLGEEDSSDSDSDRDQKVKGGLDGRRGIKGPKQGVTNDEDDDEWD